MANTIPATDLAQAPFAALEARIAACQARVGVAGLGAVGLPLAELMHGAGFELSGIDPDAHKRACLAAGRAPLAHQVHLELESMVRSPRFEAVAVPGAASGPLDVLLVCVPTDLDEAGEPDLGPVRKAIAQAAPHLASEALVVLESTTWPGTTRQVIAKELAVHGRRPGVDVALAFSPERVDPGRTELRSIPKLVGGLSPREGELAASLYRCAFDDVRLVSSAEVAEAAKLLENVYRAVNIGLVNELKGAFAQQGIDIWEVLDAAASKPFGFQRFDPGPGVGGHCIPVDPSYLAWAARRAGVPTPLVELATEINRGMPAEVARVVKRALETRQRPLQGARLLLLGLAYKPNVDGLDHAPALDLARELSAMGAEVRYHDPLLPRLPEGLALERELLGAESVPLDRANLAKFDGVLLVTAHDAIDLELVAEAARLVVDTRGVLRERLLGDPRYVPA